MTDGLHNPILGSAARVESEASSDSTTTNQAPVCLIRGLAIRGQQEPLRAQRFPKAWRYAAAIGLVAAAISIFLLRPRLQAPVPVAPQASLPKANAPQVADVAHAPAAAATASNENHEDSLRGTEIDGRVAFDANGRPKADRELPRLFD